MGSGNVREVAASVGIDVASKAFWESSLQVLYKKISYLETVS